MARKRFITSDISVDDKIASIAAENPIVALMWPWFITGFDDWGRMEAVPVKIKLSIFPAFPYTPEDIEEAINLYDKHGIVHKYEVDGKPYVAIEPEKYYKYQTYIRGNKREVDGSNCPPPPNPPWESAKDSAETHKDNNQHTDACTCVQVSAGERNCIPSPSPSPSVSKEIDKHIQSAPAEPTKHKADQQAIFDHWNQQGIIKHRALSDKIKRAINGALREYSVDEIKQAISNYAEILRGEQYYFSYKWTLKHFLQRGLEQFLEWEVCSKNYARGDPMKDASADLDSKYADIYMT